MPTEIIFDSKTAHILSEIARRSRAEETMSVIDELIAIAFKDNRKRIKIQRVRFLDHKGHALLTIDRKGSK